MEKQGIFSAKENKDGTVITLENMKEDECNIVIRMHKYIVTQVFIDTCTGRHSVVSVPIHYMQPFAIPIMTRDGIITLHVGGV